jgi:hypothetical protein
VLVPDSANISCFPDSLAKISPEMASEDKSQSSHVQPKKDIQLERMETANQNGIETDSLQQQEAVRQPTPHGCEVKSTR